LQQLLQLARLHQHNGVAFHAQEFLVAKFCQGARERFARCAHFRREHSLGPVEFDFNRTTVLRARTTFQ
jgi:hypothetical protein